MLDMRGAWFTQISNQAIEIKKACENKSVYYFFPNSLVDSIDFSDTRVQQFLNKDR
jgi:hypothetical protein